MIKGIGHVAFGVADMEKSLNFYCGALGLTKAFEMTKDDGKPWIVYIKVADGQFIELFYGGVGVTEHRVSYSHTCIEVDDIYEIAERVKAKGIVLDVEVNRGKDTNYQCWVRDPDGNRIEFMQLSSESPQSKS